MVLSVMMIRVPLILVGAVVPALLLYAACWVRRTVGELQHAQVREAAGLQ